MQNKNINPNKNSNSNENSNPNKNNISNQNGILDKIPNINVPHKYQALVKAAFALLVYVILLLLWLSGGINNYYFSIINVALINIILVVSLNLTIGFLGQLVLCHAGFMAVGAYTSALLTTHLPGLPVFVAIPLGILAGALLASFFAVVIGIPSLRLRGDYLAIITLGFGEIIRGVLINMDSITYGARGFSGIIQYSTNRNTNSTINFTVLFFMMVLTVIVIGNLTKSRQGRAIISIREDEIAAEATGVNTTYYKILAFTVSAFFAGIAGALFAHHFSRLDPNRFDFNYSIEMVIMVVLGGMGSIKGSIIAAIFLTFLPELLRFVNLAQYRMVFYSILLILIMLVKNTNLSFAIKSFFVKNFLKKRGEA